MTIDLIKQKIFDCAMELNYGASNLSNKEIAARLMGALDELDILTNQCVNTECCFYPKSGECCSAEDGCGGYYTTQS